MMSQVEENVKMKDENGKLKQVANELECYQRKCEKLEENVTMVLKQKQSLEEQVCVLGKWITTEIALLSVEQLNSRYWAFLSGFKLLSVLKLDKKEFKKNLVPLLK